MMVTWSCLSLVARSEDTAGKGEPAKKAVISLAAPRTAYRRGEVVEITTKCQQAGNVELVVVTTFEKDREIRFLVDLFNGPGDRVSKLDTSSLRPGIHTVVASLKDNQNAIVDSATLEIAVREPHAKTVSLGLFGMSDDVDPEVYFKDWSQVGIGHVFFDYAPDKSSDYLTQRLDKSLKYDVVAIPILHASEAVRYADDFSRKLTPEEQSQSQWAQVLLPDKAVGTDPRGEILPSPRSPVTAEKASKWVATSVERGEGYPGLQAVALDRGYALALNMKTSVRPAGPAGVGDYADWNLKFFEEKTGLTPPTPQPVESGFVAKNDDPFIVWSRLIGVPGDEDSASVEYLNMQLLKAARGANPDLTTMQTPGGCAGELDVVCTESDDYSVRAPELNTAFLLDYARARQDHAGKQIGAILGKVGSGDVTPYASASLNLQTKIALGKGASAVTLNSHEVAYSQDLKTAFTSLCQTTGKYGAFLAQLSPAKMPVAVLYSRTTEAYQRAVDWDKANKVWESKKRQIQRPWEQSQSFSIAYPALMLAQVPVEVITESQVEQGKLSDYKALFLIDHQYSTEAVEERIKEFQAKGNPVIADESSTVIPTGATVLPFDAAVITPLVQMGLRKQDTDVSRIVHDRMEGLVKEMAIEIRKTLKEKSIDAPIAIDSDSVAYSLSQNGDTRYLFLYNSNLFDAQKTHVTLNSQEDSIYDVLTSKENGVVTANGKTTFDAEIAAGDWGVFLLSPQEITQLRINAEQKDKEVTIQIGVLNSAGLLISGSHPLYVSIKDPKGNETPYSSHAATNLGETTVKFRLADNELTGKWKIDVTEVASGTQAKQVCEIR